MAKKKPQSIGDALPSLGRIVKQFWPQLTQQKSLMGTAFLALIAETAMRLLEPWPLKLMFDRVILPGFQVESFGVGPIENLDPFWVLTGLSIALVLISALRGVFAYWSAVNMAVAATHVMTEIRNQLYHHLQHLSLSFHNQAKSGDLITRVTYDVERLREVTVVAFLPLITNLLTLVGMLAVMFLLNAELALIAIAVLPVFLLTTRQMGNKIQTVARRQRKREGAMAASAAEAISAIQVVQALSLQGLLEKSFAQDNRKSLKESAEAQKLRAGQERLVEVLVAIAIAIVLWRGVQLTLSGVVSPGDLLVFVTYLKVAFKPMRQLAKYTGQIAKATASGERIIELMNQVPEVQDSRGATEAPPLQGAVRFENLTFAYQRDREQSSLQNLNFDVEPGQHIAIVGPSGSGKSTLVSLLLRLYDPLEGNICIDGHDIREYTIASLRRQISIVLQDTILFGSSIRDNIAYGNAEATESEMIAAAELANAHDFITQLPQGYDTIVSERGTTLSGGQRQRIAIARAAIRKAPILILDEPTTGLDNESEALVTEALQRLAQGRTTFWISHNLRNTRDADCILYLEKGRLLEQGTHQALMLLQGRYAQLYHLQADDISLVG
ncbi:ABC transporter related protein [Halothece sp. PCC 7418]|uniref:ABC transporter ATP-binding protein n=1 Tax=Halothece sp. (strain PCC 7418) TaxID=65093 RepID=UPI0002A06A37|nr:ABC transporter ATP-binding protein [Halothece sp. PCC 7418]AFZ44688.1 ABC transporter related protein [Halothece sp. PCC 7418]